MNNIIMTVEEEAPIELEYVEAKIKPEQVKDVTPDWEGFPVTPDDGCVLSRVNVAGMPEPTEIEIITENGDHNVAKKGVARVQVPIPEGYIIPSGKRVITENGTDIDVRELDAVDIAVPVPEMPEEYSIGGSYANRTLTGYHFSDNITALPAGMFKDCTLLEVLENFPANVIQIPNDFFRECQKLPIANLPDRVTSIGQYALYNCYEATVSELPSVLTLIGAAAFAGCNKCTFEEIPIGVTAIENSTFSEIGSQKMVLKGNITRLGLNAFYGMSNCIVFDFRNCTAVPTLQNRNAFFYINDNAKIVVPDDLVASWKAATNWVTYADKILGVSDYDNS